MNIGVHVSLSEEYSFCICLLNYMPVKKLRHTRFVFVSVFQVSSIIDSLEIVFNRGEMHSAVVDYEALNVIIRYEFGYHAN